MSSSRSHVYEWARERPELFRKNGSATVTDFDVLEEILDELPVDDLKAAGIASSDDAA